MNYFSESTFYRNEACSPNPKLSAFKCLNVTEMVPSIRDCCIKTRGHSFGKFELAAGALNAQKSRLTDL